MRFTSNSSSFIVEVASDKSVDIYFWPASGDNYGMVRMDESNMVEMRNWINRQIKEIRKQKKVSVSKVGVK